MLSKMKSILLAGLCCLTFVGTASAGEKSKKHAADTYVPNPAAEKLYQEKAQNMDTWTYECFSSTSMSKEEFEALLLGVETCKPIDANHSIPMRGAVAYGGLSCLPYMVAEGFKEQRQYTSKDAADILMRLQNHPSENVRLAVLKIMLVHLLENSTVHNRLDKKPVVTIKQVVDFVNAQKSERFDKFMIALLEEMPDLNQKREFDAFYERCKESSDPYVRVVALERKLTAQDIIKDIPDTGAGFARIFKDPNVVTPKELEAAIRLTERCQIDQTTLAADINCIALVRVPRVMGRFAEFPVVVSQIIENLKSHPHPTVQTYRYALIKLELGNLGVMAFLEDEPDLPPAAYMGIFNLLADERSNPEVVEFVKQYLNHPNELVREKAQSFLVFAVNNKLKASSDVILPKFKALSKCQFNAEHSDIDVNCPEFIDFSRYKLDSSDREDAKKHAQALEAFLDDSSELLRLMAYIQLMTLSYGRYSRISFEDVIAKCMKDTELSMNSCFSVLVGMLNNIPGALNDPHIRNGFELFTTVPYPEMSSEAKRMLQSIDKLRISNSLM